MLDQGLFKNHFVGRDGFVWWIGQIADENTWKANIPGFPAPTNESTEEEVIGFGERYKVRIMGYHTAAPSELLDEEFAMGNCHVILLLLVVEVEDHLKVQT